MPYGRRKRKRTGPKSRSWKRKTRRRVRRRRRIGAPAGMLGKKYFKNFRYCEQIQLDGGTGAPAVHTFRANGMFDPDLTTGVGSHQPLGFDQFVGVFYNHYTVIGAKIKCEFVSVDSTATGASIVGIEVSNNATPTTALNDIYEQGKSTYKVLTSMGSKQTCKMSRSVSIKKMAGVTNLLDNVAYRGSASSDPTEQIYIHIFHAGLSSSANPSSVTCQVTLDQAAILHEVIPLGSS